MFADDTEIKSDATKTKVVLESNIRSLEIEVGTWGSGHLEFFGFDGEPYTNQRVFIMFGISSNNPANILVKMQGDLLSVPIPDFVRRDYQREGYDSSLPNNTDSEGIVDFAIFNVWDSRYRFYRVETLHIHFVEPILPPGLERKDKLPPRHMENPGKNLGLRNRI